MKGGIEPSMMSIHAVPIGAARSAEAAFVKLRQAALVEYGILDTPPEPAFDDITRMASIALAAPVAMVSLVDETRQWFKSRLGLDFQELPAALSICSHAIQERGIVEIADLMLDPRTSGNPQLHTEPQPRFYAAAVLRTSEGIALGTVCVLDYQPRQLTPPQREMLLGLARQTMALLELRRSLLRAQAFEKGQSHYIAIAGHDLRQPLQIIAASVELSLRLNESVVIERHLGNALRAVARLGRELNHLVDTGTRERDVISPVRLERFQLKDLVSMLTVAWHDEASMKGVRLDVVASSVFIVSDRRLLGSILGNLVGNAIKYTATGRILIGCRRRAGGYIEVFVIDTGIGLSAESQALIFTPFKQIDVASDGLGLGLALVKQAADYLSYKIRIASTLGKGSRFSFLIPIADRL